VIERLHGQLVHKSPTWAVVDVHGVGYGLSISVSTFERLPAIGEQVRLFTHLHVRDDRLALFGFGDERERAMFRLLTGVPGIGPHLAQTVLSGMALGDLEAALHLGRAAELTSIKGIGRKTAERMVLDLRDKVTPGPWPADAAAAAAASPTAARAEAEMALVALGISPQVARKALEKARARDGEELTVQEMVKQALRER
jgi:holliday junction DNA helicase RuvA